MYRAKARRYVLGSYQQLNSIVGQTIWSLLVTRHIRFRRIPPDTQQHVGQHEAGERL